MPLQLVFVYGTLKADFSNHSVLGDSQFVDMATTDETYLMYSNGCYPTITPEDGGTQVRGEVYICEEGTMRDLDCLEANGAMYTRHQRLVNMDNNGMLAVWVYEYNYEHQGEQILDGNFTHEHCGGRYDRN